MLVRILITLVVIALAYVYLRKRYVRQQQRPQNGGLPARTTDPAELEQFLSRARAQGTHRTSPETAANKFRSILIVSVLVVMAASIVYSFLYWQDQQRLVTVLLHRDSSQTPVIYRVAKRNLGEGRFVTEDGTQVVVSANERMEVIGL